MTTLVTATFKTRTAAEAALNSVEALGVTDEQISLIMTDSTRGNSFNIETGNKMDEGAAAGATAGGIVGAVLGSLATASALAIPGLNVVVVGAAVSVLAGIGAGATAGGFIGGLIGLGINEHEAKIYEDEIKNGAVLLAVNAESDEQEKQIKEIFSRQDAHNIAA